MLRRVTVKPLCASPSCQDNAMLRLWANWCKCYDLGLPLQACEWGLETLCWGSGMQHERDISGSMFELASECTCL